MILYTVKDSKDYALDDTHFRAKKELVETKRDMKYSRDPLYLATANLRVEELTEKTKATELALTNNIDRLFRACELLNIPRIYIGTRELVGADGVDWDGWSAVWALKELLEGDVKRDYEFRFAAGCGNADQSQTENTAFFFPEEYIEKAWDVKTREEVDIEPFKKRMVVTYKGKSPKGNW